MDNLNKSIYNKLYEVYEEIPVSIDQFLEDPEYLGSMTNCGKAIYPKWRYHLRKIFEDPYKYNEIALTGVTIK